MLTGGMFIPQFKTRVRVNNRPLEAGLGASLEDDLNLQRSRTTGYLNAYWRFRDRHRLQAGWFSFDRDALATTTEQVTLGDGNVIDAGASALTRFSVDILPISYAYSFFKDRQHELAWFVGLHWADIDFEVEADAWVNKSGQGASGRSRLTSSAVAPMPLLGLKYRHNLTDRWTAGLSAGYFALSLNSGGTDYEGSFYNLKAETEYWLWKQTAIGLAINALGLEASFDDSKWHGNLDYRLWGPIVYLKVRI